jgi:hypothetical protein
VATDMTTDLVTEASDADTSGVSLSTIDPDKDELVREIEKWLTASASRTNLFPEDIRELQTLLLGVHTALVGPPAES